jgi:hypothetical protein
MTKPLSEHTSATIAMVLVRVCAAAGYCWYGVCGYCAWPY